MTKGPVIARVCLVRWPGVGGPTGTDGKLAMQLGGWRGAGWAASMALATPGSLLIIGFIGIAAAHDHGVDASHPWRDPGGRAGEHRISTGHGLTDGSAMR